MYMTAVIDLWCIRRLNTQTSCQSGLDGTPWRCGCISRDTTPRLFAAQVWDHNRSGRRAALSLSLSLYISHVKVNSAAPKRPLSGHPPSCESSASPLHLQGQTGFRPAAGTPALRALALDSRRSSVARGSIRTESSSRKRIPCFFGAAP
eukprot:TRINITY_DN9605_c0_g1_i1.p1 TRINITY_DN9605_c0_g1~~TRINITY_DN9605_c0_g1_i1.p1  ORF type:complete len:149 (-),score=1.21 TRINITY_DN9605_c0_g1_i1:21-467(-)